MHLNRAKSNMKMGVKWWLLITVLGGLSHADGQLLSQKNIMAYGSTPYVGMTPKKNGGHIQSAQMTRSKCPR